MTNDTDLEDRKLLELWRQGDQQASDTLLRRHGPSLLRFFQNKTATDADDIVQQTMIAAMNGLDRFEGRSSFRAYLFSIARYTLYEHYRQVRRRNVMLEFNTVTLFDVSPSPSMQAAERDEHRLLLQALRHIPINMQIALELHYWEDLTGPELAEILELPLDTAYSRLRRAKELLKKELSKLASSRAVLPATEQDLAGWARSIGERSRIDGFAHGKDEDDDDDDDDEDQEVCDGRRDLTQ